MSLVERRFPRWLVVPLAILCAAPTVGDIGSCGQTPEDLDLTKFTQEKEQIDCSHCGDCGITSTACSKACDQVVDAVPFPAGCAPLVHDGEVCLNALDAAGCNAYEGYMADANATIPSECNFCPPRPEVSAQGGSP